MLQQKCDQLEALGVLQKPGDVGIAWVCNPSFLVKKPNGGYRHITAFEDLMPYKKTQPSLMPDVESVLHRTMKTHYLRSDKCFPSDTPFTFIPEFSLRSVGIRAYTRCAMGMTGSETTPWKRARVSRSCWQKQSESVATLWWRDNRRSRKKLESYPQGPRKKRTTFIPPKITIYPRMTTILGWTWSEGKISASQRRISALFTCDSPDTLFGLRFFLGMVIPKCAVYRPWRMP